MELFKFLERKFLDSFFETGSLRLGTIYDFKDILTHSLARGDNQEGSDRVGRRVNGTFKISKDTDEPVISDFFKYSGDGFGTISNFGLIIERTSPDGFIFCTSNKYSNELFKLWERDDIKTNACYMITNAYGFFKEIEKVIRSSVYYGENRNIEYTSDPIPYDSPSSKIEPAFTKSRKKYSWQSENRTLWYPKDPSGRLEPWIIEVPEARKYCKPFSYIEKNEIKFFKFKW